MKGQSEARVKKALDQMDLDLWSYKPPDDALNRKPSDFIVWFSEDETPTKSSFVEVKQAGRLALSWPISELQPSQRLGIRKAAAMDLDYWLVIWFPRLRKWAICDGPRLLASGLRSFTFVDLVSRYGCEAQGPHLASVLRSVLVGDVI